MGKWIAVAVFVGYAGFCIIQSPRDEHNLTEHRISTRASYPCPGEIKPDETCVIIDPKRNVWQTVPLPPGKGGLRIKVTGTVTSQGATAGPEGAESEPIPDGVRGMIVPGVAPRLSLNVRGCGENYDSRSCEKPRTFVRNTMKIPYKEMFEASHLEMIVNNVNRVVWGEVTDWFGYSEGGFRVSITREGGWN